MVDGSTFLQAFTILFREGLEALLIVSALAAFLRRAGAAERIASLYAGAGAAVIASAIMAWVFWTYFDGNHSDLFEAAVMIAAAALMFTMSGWLFVRQNPKAWQAELDRLAQRALGAGTVLSLAGIAFLAVFREGAETILFLQALAKSANGFDGALLAGLAAASLALAAMFGAMQWLALRLPLRPMFLVTSAFLFVMGLKLVGEAIQELQEQTIVSVHNETVPDIVTTLGLNGSWEALAAQGTLVLIALACLVTHRLRRRRTGSGPLSPRATVS